MATFDLESVHIDSSLPLPYLLRSVERQIADAPVEVSFAFNDAGVLVLRKQPENKRALFSPSPKYIF